MASVGLDEFSSTYTSITPLTPNDFLHSQMGGVSTPESVDELEFSLKNRQRRVQELILSFGRDR